MTPLASFFLVLGFGLIAWLIARAKAADFGPPLSKRDRFIAPPTQHGWYAAVWTMAPALLFVALWTVLSPVLAADMVRRGSVAGYPAARWHFDWIGAIAAMVLACAGGGYAIARVAPEFVVRTRVERMAAIALLASALAALLILLAITVSLLAGSAPLLGRAPIGDILSGNYAAGAPGALRLLSGTLVIGAAIAMAVAVPLGVLSALYLVHFVAPATRRRAGPIVDMLAGVPTVVYGYFAAMTVAPVIHHLDATIGLSNAWWEGVQTAGVVLGVMILPSVSLTARDAIERVSGAMLDGSLAIGAKPTETIRHLILPAALPGVAGGVLLALSRAIGETTIVVMAAFAVAALSRDPVVPVTTLTAQIFDLAMDTARFDATVLPAAFALGLAVFVVTLLLNLIGQHVLHRHRQTYV